MYTSAPNSPGGSKLSLASRAARGGDRSYVLRLSLMKAYFAQPPAPSPGGCQYLASRAVDFTCTTYDPTYYIAIHYLTVNILYKQHFIF